MGFNSGLTFSEAEQRVFDEVLLLGETTTGKLIKRLGMHKGTAYNVVRRLEEKGYLSYRNISGVKHISVNIALLRQVLMDKKSEFDETCTNLQNLINRALAIKADSSETSIDVITGERGFKAFFDDVIHWAHQSKKAYFFIGKGNELIEKLGQEYYERTQVKKKRLGIKSYALLSMESKKLPVKKYIYANVRYLKAEKSTPTSIWLWNDAVTIVLWDTKPVTCINIHSIEAYQAFKNHFDNLWKSAKK